MARLFGVGAVSLLSLSAWAPTVCVTQNDQDATPENSLSPPNLLPLLLPRRHSSFLSERLQPQEDPPPPPPFPSLLLLPAVIPVLSFPRGHL